MAAAERHRAGSFVIALTGDPSAPLASHADAVMPLVAERAEAAGIATLSYRSTVAALAMLVDRAEGRTPGAGLPAAVPALEALLAGRDGVAVGRGGRARRGVARSTSSATGRGSALVEQAALMLREAPRIAAYAFDTGDWLHVGLYTLLPGDPVLLFSGAAADDAAIATAISRGGRVVVVGPAREGRGRIGHAAGRGRGRPRGPGPGRARRRRAARGRALAADDRDDDPRGQAGVTRLPQRRASAASRRAELRQAVDGLEVERAPEHEDHVLEPGRPVRLERRRDVLR